MPTTQLRRHLSRSTIANRPRRFRSLSRVALKEMLSIYADNYGNESIFSIGETTFNLWSKSNAREIKWIMQRNIV